MRITKQSKLTTKRNLARIAAVCMALFLMMPANKSEAQVNLSADVHDRWHQNAVLKYKNNFVETVVGDIPLVISVPHGGTVRPKNIPKRECKVAGQGRLVTGVDGRTVPTARAIQEAFEKKYNKKPYVIISHIARTQVDQNRPLELGACGNKRAEAAWYDFHNSIDTALALAVQKFGFAIYIDLHGHGHEVQRLELGYSLTGPDLEKAFTDGKARKQFGGESSMQNFLTMYGADKFHDVLWGEYSLGTLFENHGVAASPSKQDPFPLTGEKFFSGGYNTRRYTSSDYPKVFGVQIECNFRGVRDTEESREKFANALAESYTQFVEHHKLLK